MELTTFKAVILGIVQGLTEFLPISSSGHLVIAQHFLGVDLEGGGLLAFDLCLHLGTLLAVIAIFYKDIFYSFYSLINPKIPNADDFRSLFWFLVIGTIPAGIFGYLLDDFFERAFSNPQMACFMLLITGVILWCTKYVKKEGRPLSKMGYKDSLLVGFGQAVAIMPGISRSGTTIATGIYSGLDRTLSAKFSFLLSIPAILGATVLKADDLKGVADYNIIAVVAGTFFAFLVGWLSIKFLLSVITKRHFHYFAIYRWLVGLGVLITLAL